MSVIRCVMRAFDLLSADKVERSSLDAHAEIGIAYNSFVLAQSIVCWDVCIDCARLGISDQKDLETG
jgi:hypothetical protein